MKKKDLSMLALVFGAVLVILVAVNVYLTLTLAPSPVEVKLTEIEVSLLGSDCTDCANLSVLIDSIKSVQGFNVAKVNVLSLAESSELAEKYNISALQAFIVTGDIGNISSFAVSFGESSIDFEKMGDAFVFGKSPAPYYDIAKKRVVGLVDVIIVQDSSCDICFNLSPSVNQMKNLGIAVKSSRFVERTSEEGKALISKYKIEKLPVLILNNEALVYEVLAQTWSVVGSEEEDGALVLRLVSPPLINASTGSVEGLVDLTYLVDNSCADCYNASIFKTLFEDNFKMFFEEEQTVDVSSARGRLLVKKYGIDLVPTVILSKDAVQYPNVAELWAQALGTVEKDGSLVFRAVSRMNEALNQDIVYKNVSSGMVVDTAKTSNETG